MIIVGGGWVGFLLESKASSSFVLDWAVQLFWIQNVRLMRLVLRAEMQRGTGKNLEWLAPLKISSVETLSRSLTWEIERQNRLRIEMRNNSN